MTNLEIYRQWLAAEAKAINSDGCTLVSEVYHDCCLEHDLAYRHKKDPLAAFLVGWEKAPAISRKAADVRFRDCMQSVSPVGKWSPVSWIRYAGVRLLGRFVW